VNPPDLLDQVDFAGDVVVPVQRHGRPQCLPPAGDLEVETLQVLRAELWLDGHSQQGVHPRGAQLEPVRFWDLGRLIDRPRD
jgi:hypothetical protein